MLGGVTADVLSAPGFNGWVGSAPYSFMLNGFMGQFIIQSDPVDLQLTGEAYFSMEMYCYEVSTTSNFEAIDEFTPKLLLTMDDDTQTEVSLLPVDLDLDGDGKLTGDEFNPGLLDATKRVVVGRQLRAVIPANAKSVALQVTGADDSGSGSETLSFGGAMISDTPLDTDEDGDGVNRGAELFAGTDPSDPLSYFHTTEVSLEFRSTLNPPAWIFNNTFTLVNGKTYAAEESTDGGATWEIGGFITATATETVPIYVVLGATPPERFFQRFRCIP
jgi:hypothetical protein